MKLRSLAVVAVLVLTALAAHAQTQNQSQGNFSLYLNPVAIRVSNPTPDTGPFAFLGQNSTSQVFYGFDLGGYYDFFHFPAASPPAWTCARATCTPTTPCSGASWQASHLRPTLQAPLQALYSGLGRPRHHQAPKQHRPPQQGRLCPLRRCRLHAARHVDFRVFELGYGSLTTVSSATVGNGGTLMSPRPASSASAPAWSSASRTPVFAPGRGGAAAALLRPLSAPARHLFPTEIC